MKCKSGKHEWTDPRDAVMCCDGVHCRTMEIVDGSGGEIADIIVVRSWGVCPHEWQSSYPFTHKRCVRCNRVEELDKRPEKVDYRYIPEPRCFRSERWF